MIPITAGFVGSGNLCGSRMRGFSLSLVYVAGVAVTYAGLGVFAALTGSFFGEVSSNPWITFAVANIIILFGLSMLDVFHLPMVSGTVCVEKGGLMGAFLMGLVSGFVAAPCTAPVLGVLLTYVATSGNLVFGGGLLFVFAVGMGTLLVLVGTFSGFAASLPKSGKWMERVKKGLGLCMIGIGEYFLIQTGRQLF
jgi:thiol:disulfide interchange protein DsbD